MTLFWAFEKERINVGRGMLRDFDKNYSCSVFFALGDVEILAEKGAVIKRHT